MFLSVLLCIIVSLGSMFIGSCRGVGELFHFASTISVLAEIREGSAGVVYHLLS